MVKLTRFNGSVFYLNAELIISVEATPDTVITLADHGKLLVKEPPEEVVKKIITYRRIVYNPEIGINSGEE